MNNLLKTHLPIKNTVENFKETYPKGYSTLFANICQLKNREECNTEVLNSHLERAIKNDLLDIIPLFINSARFPEISKLNLSIFLQKATRKARLDIVQALIQSDRFQEVSTSILGFVHKKL